MMIVAWTLVDCEVVAVVVVGNRRKESFAYSVVVVERNIVDFAFVVEVAAACTMIAFHLPALVVVENSANSSAAAAAVAVEDNL